MFAPSVRDTIVRQARRNGIEPAALLAVVEIESAGKMFEPADGKTPRLLFERHVFYRELKKRAPNKLDAASRKGLTRTSWDRATQYRDQGTSQARLRLIAQARSVDVECANRSTSWGLGQTMGFNAPAMGFASATEMVDYMTKGGVDAQVDCLIREIKRNKLERPLARKEWAAFARGYNGPGYRANRYDSKLAAAYAKWIDALDPETPETGDEPIELPQPRPKQIDPEVEHEPADEPDPADKPMTKSKTMWGGILAWLGGVSGSIIGMFEYIATPWGFAALVFIVAVISIGLWLIIKGRLDVQKVVKRLSAEVEEAES